MKRNEVQAQRFEEVAATATPIGAFPQLPANAEIAGKITSDEANIRNVSPKNGAQRVMFGIPCQFELSGKTINLDVPCNSKENASNIWTGNIIKVRTTATGFPVIVSITEPTVIAREEMATA